MLIIQVISARRQKKKQINFRRKSTVIVAKNKTTLEQIIKHFCEAPGMAKGIKHIKINRLRLLQNKQDLSLKIILF